MDGIVATKETDKTNAEPTLQDKLDAAQAELTESMRVLIDAEEADGLAQIKAAEAMTYRETAVMRKEAAVVALKALADQA